MPTIAEGWAGTGGGLLLGDERRKLQEAVQLLHNAYMEGPFVLPPEQLLSQLKEQGPDLLYDLVQQLQWETLGAAGYAQDLTAERTRAIDESRRLWKYSPIAQWLIWLMTNYGFGENVVIVPEDEDAIETWDEFWTADRNQPVLAADQIAELSNWTLVDGDRFLVYYADAMDGETTVRTINTKEIVEIVTDPDDSSVSLYYKRQWTNAQHRQQTWYYPDYRAFFDGTLSKAKLPTGAIQAEKVKIGTVVVMQHIAFNGKDPDSLYGWPFLGTGAPWIRAHKRHLENRLAVSASKAMYVRKATVKGGSRAVDSVIANLRSALSSTQAVETNPPAVAGSTLVENQAVTTTDFPMTTGASDAKVDELMFLRQAALSGGVYPHYMGAGDAYRLATACYSSDTQVLTDSGWKHWFDWRAGEKIAAYDHDTQTIRYVVPTKLHVYDYKGEMIHIKARSIDALVTPNHRMLAINENWRTYQNEELRRSTFEVIQAKDLPSDFSLPTKATVEDRPDIKRFLLPGHTATPGTTGISYPDRFIDMDAWLRFIGWYVSDGSISIGSGGCSTRISQKKEAGICKIDAMLAELPLKFTRSIGKRGMVCWASHDRALYRWLKENCGKGATNKHLPNFAIQLNKRQARILLEAIWAGDGTMYDPSVQTHAIGALYSISEEVMNQCQILLLHIGGWSSLRREKKLRKKRANRSCWLNWSDYDKKLLFRYRNVSQVNYEGIVWCFEAPPYGMFITRRNGCLLIAGNTAMEAPVQRQFSRYQVFWSAQFRKMVRIVLQMDEKYNGASFETYKAEVSTDKLVEVDLDGMSRALGRVFQTIINPQAKLGAMPAEVLKGMLQASLRTILQALGVDAETVIGDDVWPEAEEVEPREPEREEEEPELEESIALALQNYRSGLVDADDLVAFLVPSRLEEAEGPGKGWWGPPKGTHGTGRQVQVGITSARPGKTTEQIEKEMDEFRTLMEETPVKNLSIQLGTGGWEGGSEPTWVTQYDGDGEAMKVLAQSGKKWDQDAVLVMQHVTEGGQPQTRLAFAEEIDMPEMREIEKVLVSEGIGGWTWAEGKDGPVLIATSIPQWGGEKAAHLKASSTIWGILKEAGYSVGLKALYVDVTVMERDTYDDFISD